VHLLYKLAFATFIVVIGGDVVDVELIVLEVNVFITVFILTENGTILFVARIDRFI
jgi:hypothetical protein